MEQYIRNTFGAAKGSISINGMDSKELEAELAKAQDGEGTPCILGPKEKLNIDKVN